MEGFLKNSQNGAMKWEMHHIQITAINNWMYIFNLHSHPQPLPVRIWSFQIYHRSADNEIHYLCQQHQPINPNQAYSNCGYWISKVFLNFAKVDLRKKPQRLVQSQNYEELTFHSILYSQTTIYNFPMRLCLQYFKAVNMIPKMTLQTHLCWYLSSIPNKEQRNFPDISHDSRGRDLEKMEMIFVCSP